MLELWRWVVKPGECYTSTGHPQGTTELLHVERGQLHVQVGTAEVMLATGASAIAQTDQAHSYANRGDEDVVFYMTVAEPWARYALGLEAD